MRPSRLVPVVALVLAGGLISPAAATPGAEPLPTQALVRDARGDAEGTSAELRRLADVTRVRYRMPSTRSGSMTVRVRWAELREPRPGVRLRQGIVIFVDTRTGDRSTGVADNGLRSPVSIVLIEQGDEVSRVRPEEVAIAQTFGRRGLTEVTVSTEWLTAPRARVSTGAVVERRRGVAVDETGERRLRVGPVR